LPSGGRPNSVEARLINPAGFSFGCVPVLDALKLIRKPLVEVHLTNIRQRPDPYRHSLVSSVATGVICGLGPVGYLLAVRAVAEAMSPGSGSGTSAVQHSRARVQSRAPRRG
jgi:3-dehydroquinate dehydratase-2